MTKKTLALVSCIGILLAGMIPMLLLAPPVQGTDFEEPGYALIAAPKFGTVSHANEALKLREYLVDRGWSDDQIIFLGKWTDKDFVDGKATKENIEAGIDEIGLKATENDIIFIAVLDHGQDGNDGHIYLRAGDITDETYIKDTEFQGWVDDIETFRHQVIYIASPYSGNFVSIFEGKNRIVLSDCGIDQVYKAGEISFYKALTESKADIDNDGKVSIEEAYEWMEDKKRKLDPQLSDFDEDADCFLF